MDLEERARVARLLKAARWLRGGANGKGQPQPLTPQDLADLEPLKRNGITANRISEFERLVTPAREMELGVIVSALELPHDWFETPGAEATQLDRIEALLERIAERLDLTALDADADPFVPVPGVERPSHADRATSPRTRRRGGSRD